MHEHSSLPKYCPYCGGDIKIIYIIHDTVVFVCMKSDFMYAVKRK